MTTGIEITTPGTRSPAELTKSPDKNAIAKVMADISFLRDRIAQLQSHRSPNTAVLQTYTAMLASREMALALMQEVANGRHQ